MEKWSGKIAVVTGGSSGMGRTIVKKFLDSNIQVINLDVNPSDNKKGHYIKCDVSDIAAVKKAFKEIEEKFKFIHILINNAGIIRTGKVLDMSDKNTANLNKIIDVNFTGLVHVSREGYQLIKQSNDYGLIVNFCSIAGHQVTPFGNPFMTYSPTKHAVKAFSEVLRQELIVTGDEKVRVTNLSPGSVNTSILEASGASVVDQFFSGPIIQPEDVADSILYLLSTPYNVNITEITIKPVGERW